MFKIFVMIIATNPASRFDEEDVYRGESLKYWRFMSLESLQILPKMDINNCWNNIKGGSEIEN